MHGGEIRFATLQRSRPLSAKVHSVVLDGKIPEWFLFSELTLKTMTIEKIFEKVIIKSGKIANPGVRPDDDRNYTI